MKLVIRLLADYANITPEGKLNVMGVFTDVNAVGYPARHPRMFVVLKFAPELGELDQTKTLKVKMEDADGKTIHSISLPLEIKRNAQGQRGDASFIIELNDIVFPKPGTYEFVVYLDDNEQMGEIAVSANLIKAD